MGQHAEDMLEGVTCEGCGMFFDDILEGGEAPGYPRRCASCEDPQPAPATYPMKGRGATIRGTPRKTRT